VRPTLFLLAGLALSFSVGPAYALKNIAACDIVAFAAKDSPIAVTDAQWLDYRAAIEAALAKGSGDPRSASADVVAAQTSFLASIKGSAAYQDYLAGDSCLLMSKLDASVVDALLEEAAKSLPERATKALRDIVQASRTQIDRIERTARFRSNRDKTLFAAQYYCFVAATIAAFLPPDRRAEIALEDFGETASCKEAGRTA